MAGHDPDYWKKKYAPKKHSAAYWRNRYAPKQHSASYWKKLYEEEDNEEEKDSLFNFFGTKFGKPDQALVLFLLMLWVIRQFTK